MMDYRFVLDNGENKGIQLYKISSYYRFIERYRNFVVITGISGLVWLGF